MNGYLLDTNVPSELTYARPNPSVVRWLYEVNQQQLFFSVISIAEICKGIAKLPDSRKRHELQLWLDNVVRVQFAGRILPINESIAERLGFWAGTAQAQGRIVKLADGLIAATAVEHELTLVTRNLKDFADFKLPVINPWEPC